MFGEFRVCSYEQKIFNLMICDFVGIFSSYQLKTTIMAKTIKQQI